MRPRTRAPSHRLCRPGLLVADGGEMEPVAGLAHARGPLAAAALSSTAATDPLNVGAGSNSVLMSALRRGLPKAWRSGELGLCQSCPWARASPRTTQSDMVSLVAQYCNYVNTPSCSGGKGQVTRRGLLLWAASVADKRRAVLLAAAAGLGTGCIDRQEVCQGCGR